MTEAKKNAELFREWATSISCPQDAIPSEDTLKSVFSSRQRDFFETLMKRIRPRQEAEENRRKILVKEINKLNDRVVPASRRCFLPPQLQTYLNIKDLEKKRAEIMERIADHKEQFELVSGSFKSKNIKVFNAENRNSLLRSKVAIIVLKNKSLDQNIKNEEEIKARILLYMPVKLNSQNVNDHLINEAIQKSLTELEDFDDWATKHNNNASELKNAREKLWNKLRTILSNVPNFLLFKRIMHIKEQKFDQLRDLNKSNRNESLTHSSTIFKEPINEFEKKLMKLKIDALALFVHHKKAVEKREQIEDLFCERFNLSINEIREKVAATNPNENDEHIDEVLSEFMMQKNWHENLKAANECLQKQIDQMRHEKSQLAHILGTHEVLFGAVQQAYVDTDTSVNKIQNEIEQFRSIKMKIIYSANLLKHKHKESSVVQSNFVNTISNHHPNQAMKSNAFAHTSNYVVGSADSFECSGMIAEGKFSSTLLDLEPFDRSFATGDTTLIAGYDMRSNGPPHSLEIKNFANISLQHFSYINKECAFLVGANPLVTESGNPSSILQSTPATLLTPCAALQEVRHKIAFADLIALQSSELNLGFEIETDDVSSYNERNMLQHDIMKELFDKLDFNEILIRRSLRKCWNVLEFIVENPLRHYIPSSVVYNNKTYQEYETEHKTYMGMIKDCDSLK